ncbi:uncharacterized protein SCHCODRAFT_01175908 [Schizophyllum commune H4-8]|uniref:G-patch domain-containing protein n=1 Tax=Schizophyllum commune (strain H4-8 / FGSC 9210) TaxID=578458 RepID=D8QIS2_SCHCM|nr:uncharacterized protein SCHCODRAFT_01175908 [Schizophyllum commune H4-8]KAI5886122.1 hypothetical protein SCHCODRAFT_01175908 [Schizophyllum commune H4-8]
MSTVKGDVYGPELEFPGDSSTASYAAYGVPDGTTSNHPLAEHQEEGEIQDEVDYPSKSKLHPIFRLVVDSSSILPPKHRIAVIDGYSSVEIGRDAQIQGSTTPRVRLKELEVSKIHATAYWDGAQKEWNIVDMGSKHGTFVRAAADPQGSDARLSQPRVASLPRRLSHADALTIGGTVFTVHIHSDGLACEECSIGTLTQEIPLFPKTKTAGVKRTREDAQIDEAAPIAQPRVNAKRALHSLRSELLSRTTASAAISGPTKEYTDRSARRRALQPTPHTMSPGVQTPRVYSPAPPKPVPLSRPAPSWEPPPRPRTPTSAPPVPIAASSIGHKLLMKQGWEPGTALGTSSADDEGGERMALLEPLQTVVLGKRAGLGSTPASGSSTPQPAGDGDWKEEARRRRWQSTQ